MKPSEILEKAFAKIEKPESWTKNKYARNEAGEEADPRGTEATCWCSIGALHTVEEYHDCGSTEYEYLKDAAHTLHCQRKGINPKTLLPRALSIHNDIGTHEQVCEFWRLAIANAKKDEDETL